MRTTITQLKTANDDLYQAMRTIKWYSLYQNLPTQ